MEISLVIRNQILEIIFIMQFSYQARNTEGEIVKGNIEANDEPSAISSLRSKGFYISKINSKTDRTISKIFSKKTGLKDKIIFTQQLGIMIKSGLSVVDALKALKDETSNKKFSEQIANVISDVKGGLALSKAMEKYPDSFDDVYVNSVKAGEKSGKVDMVLIRLAKQLEKDYALTSKVKGAMIYPAVILTALIAVVVLVLIFVIPELKAVFDDVGVPLPLLTRIVLGISSFLQNYFIYILAVCIGIFFALRYYSKTDNGRHLFDRLKLKIPVLGGLYKKTYMAKFTRTFASLSSSGLPLLDIFKSSRDVVTNVIYQDAIDEMTKKIENGESISKVIKDSPLFPSMIGQLSTVGEKSGNIDEVFDSMANFFDKEVDNITNNLSTLLEPILMVVMGVGIGLLIVAVLQPIYGLVETI